MIVLFVIATEVAVPVLTLVSYIRERSALREISA